MHEAGDTIGAYRQKGRGKPKEGIALPNRHIDIDCGMRGVREGRRALGVRVRREFQLPR